MDRPRVPRALGASRFFDAWTGPVPHDSNRAPLEKREGAKVLTAAAGRLRGGPTVGSRSLGRRRTMATVRFHTPLGAEVQVPVRGESPSALSDAVLELQRTLGSLGWRAATAPPGGFRFPLANEPDFDWRLFGARRGTGTVEGEERDGVWHAGQFFTRRELEPNPRMKLGAAVKYSRGARSTDPPQTVEDGGGDFRYVTLAVFRGEGRRREELAVPESERQAEHAPEPRGATPAPPGRRHARP